MREVRADVQAAPERRDSGAVRVDSYTPRVAAPPTAVRTTAAGLRDVIPAVAATTAVALPSFLVGALAVQIKQQMHFGVAILGVVVATYQLTAAVVSIPSTRLVRRLGALRVLRAAPVVASLVLVAVAGLANSWAVLAAMMVVAGAASGTAQPSANLLLARRVDIRSQGLAFGIKQSAIPLAGLLSGLAVPTIALTVGWRWAFALAAVLAVAAALAVPTRGTVEPDAERGRKGPERSYEPRLPLVVLAIGFGVALAAASSLAAFLVPAGVAAGLARGTAGLVAALGAATALGVRVLAGYRADRRGRAHFPVVAALIGAGAIGFGLLAAGSALHSPAVFVPGAVLAYGVGWGWNGLFNFAIVRTHAAAPARATAATQTGGRLGNVVGPVLLGVLASRFGYEAAWSLAVGEALAGAGLILLGRKLLRAARADWDPAGSARSESPGTGSVQPVG